MLENISAKEHPTYQLTKVEALGRGEKKAANRRREYHWKSKTRVSQDNTFFFNNNKKKLLLVFGPHLDRKVSTIDFLKYPEKCVIKFLFGRKKDLLNMT